MNSLVSGDNKHEATLRKREKSESLGLLQPAVKRTTKGMILLTLQGLAMSFLHIFQRRRNSRKLLLKPPAEIFFQHSSYSKSSITKRLV
jgi:hypothetical protein